MAMLILLLGRMLDLLCRPTEGSGLRRTGLGLLLVFVFVFVLDPVWCQARFFIM